jgi:hypothetical protein
LIAAVIVSVTSAASDAEGKFGERRRDRFRALGDALADRRGQVDARIGDAVDDVVGGDPGLGEDVHRLRRVGRRKRGVLADPLGGGVQRVELLLGDAGRGADAAERGADAGHRMLEIGERLDRGADPDRQPAADDGEALGHPVEGGADLRRLGLEPVELLLGLGDAANEALDVEGHRAARRPEVYAIGHSEGLHSGVLPAASERSMGKDVRSDRGILHDRIGR